MKLAVLLYGQPRFWNLSYESIIEETTFEDSTTDYYFHFWDRVAYHSHDPEYKLTNKDKDNIISKYKPKKYIFTDYSSLRQTCQKIFEIVQTNKQNIISFYDRTRTTSPNFNKSIFEVTSPENLMYYLGQFVSLQQGANLINEKYDYIFRIRTDVLFATQDLYKNKKEYIHDKQLFYERVYNNEKGVFCKYGDLQLWEGAYNNQEAVPEAGVEEDHQAITTNICDSFIFKENKMYVKPRYDSMSTYNYKTQYLHMKDWYILGSGPELLRSIKNYITTIIDMIEKSRAFIKKNNIDVNWSAGELVCGEVLGLNGINAGELGYKYINKMTIPDRIIKIANKHTKKCILDRTHVRVLADSDIPLKEQYKKIIIKENGS